MLPCLNKRTPQSGNWEFPEPADRSKKAMPCLIIHMLWPWFCRSSHAQILSLAQYRWNTGLAVVLTWIIVLLTYCISSCSNLDNHSPGLYLILQCYLEINCLSLKLLVWCLLPYLESVTQWCHLKPFYSTTGRNPRDEGEMQHPGAGGR